MSSLMTIPTKALIRKELKSYFSTPLGYVFLVIFLFGIGHVTFEPGRGSFFLMRQADLSSFFSYLPWMYLILIPAVSMRTWAEERKSGSIEILLTFPITVWQALMGKYLASLIFVALSLLGTLPIVGTVLYLGNPDLGVILISYLGAFFVAANLLAVGTFFSALTKNQVVSFILSVVSCYLLLMAGSPALLDFLSSFLPSYGVQIFEEMSILNHYEDIYKGVFKLSDLWFFCTTTAGWLFMSYVLLQERKNL